MILRLFTISGLIIILIGTQYANAAIQITIDTDKPKYMLGETIRVIGRISSDLRDTIPLELFVINPDNSIIITQTIHAQFTESKKLIFLTAFSLSEKDVSGVYKIIVFASPFGVRSEASTTFEFINTSGVPFTIGTAIVSEPKFTNLVGESLTNVSVAQQTLIQSQIANTQNSKVPFVYIVQVKDSDGVNVSLSWMSGELQPKSILTAAQSWLPDKKGEYG